MSGYRPIRVVCATRGRTGRAGFNQVALSNGLPPRGVLLTAICPAEGLRLWMKPFSVVEPYTKAQHRGYSRSLSVSVDNPPDYLGEPVFITRDDVDQAGDGLFEQIIGAHTNTKNKLVRELFGF